VIKIAIRGCFIINEPHNEIQSTSSVTSTARAATGRVDTGADPTTQTGNSGTATPDSLGRFRKTPQLPDARQIRQKWVLCWLMQLLKVSSFQGCDDLEFHFVRIVLQTSGNWRPWPIWIEHTCRSSCPIWPSSYRGPACGRARIRK
jgi:hypothetical protein